jgi:hypothetical protein
MIMHSNVQDFIQNVAISKGSHAYKFGGELRQIQLPLRAVLRSARRFQRQPERDGFSV